MKRATSPRFQAADWVASTCRMVPRIWAGDSAEWLVEQAFRAAPSSVISSTFRIRWAGQRRGKGLVFDELPHVGGAAQAAHVAHHALLLGAGRGPGVTGPKPQRV